MKLFFSMTTGATDFPTGTSVLFDKIAAGRVRTIRSASPDPSLRSNAALARDRIGLRDFVP